MFDQNILFYGDNLEFLADPDVFPSESVDLIYLDPPFNSNATYNMLFKEASGEPSTAQIKAFDDTWSWDAAAAAALNALLKDSHTPRELSALITTFHKFLGHSPMLAYLVQMAVRLIHMRRVLKPTGSLYLHCDPTASHYLKLVLDGIFGRQQFRNEIVWKRSHPKGHAFTRFATSHDIILGYAKDSKRTIWNQLWIPHDEKRVKEQYSLVDDDERRYQLTSLLNPNPDRPNLTYEFKGVTRVWRWTRKRMEAADREGLIVVPKGGSGIPRFKRYLDEQLGIPVGDFWEDIPIAAGNERLGYPTQKPIGLLKRIVSASSNPGDVVLDPFCGCGTTIDAVETLNRPPYECEPPRIWLGIDVTHLAINLIKSRIARFDPPVEYEVIGEPVDLTGAKQLFNDDAHQFQLWACGLVGTPDSRARGGSRKAKKGADRGIDGVRHFVDDKSGPKAILVQVKGGKTGSADIRDFRGTLEREDAAMGIFISLRKPTKPMVIEAASAGMYTSPGSDPVPRLQIVTIEQLLSGGTPRQPAGVLLSPSMLDPGSDRTIKKAKRHDAGSLFQR